VATALAGDAEMARRISRHRQRRPSDWCLVEEPLALAEVLARECAPDRCILVDCLTLWLTNWLVKADQSGVSDRIDAQIDPGIDHGIDAPIEALLAAVEGAPGRLILVGNETSMGVVPLGELSRRFCDLAGVLHQDLAARCDQVILTVAGLPLTLKGSAP
jgi:adenosylcobinamide kinase / adenosylcobinamide-phosphate guanylyltransferase